MGCLTTTCIDCGSASSNPLDFEYPLQQCTTCGLVYARQWNDGFDSAFYDYYAERLTWPAEAFFRPATTASINSTLSWLSSFTAGRRLLDVGCGEGQIVHAATAAGWRAEGIDLSESAIRICTERFSLSCRTIDFFSDELLGGYDVITMSELIEHVSRPSTFLRRAHDLLSPGGIVYLTTPNFASLGRRILRDEWAAIGDGHVAYFTPETLRQKAADSGLLDEEVFTKNLSSATLKRLMHRTTPLATPSAIYVRSTGYAEEQGLRSAIESRWTLRTLKSTTNRALRLTSLGETLVGVFRPRHQGSKL